MHEIQKYDWAIRLGLAIVLLVSIGPGVFAHEVADSDKAFLRTPKHSGIYVVAHRGAHTGIPDNSLAAYEKAIELGVDFVEIDIRATKDGKLVSIHNASIDAYVEALFQNIFHKCHTTGAIVIVDESDPSCWEDAHR
ncbi:MAG: glycerophosphodiester phosphodiesterase family protein [Pirellulales bacterium]